VGHDWSNRPLSRRTVLRWGAAAGASLAAMPVLQACSRDPNAPTGDGAGTSPTQASGASTVEKLGPYDPNRPAGGKPSLPAVIAWANFTNIEFFQRVTRTMQAAAKDVGLEFLTASAQGEVAKNVDQMQSFLQRGVGALATTPIDPKAQAATLQDAVDKGVCTIGNVIVPATIHDVASQYRIGYQQGESAAKYVNDRLGGEAQALFFNNDRIPALKPKAQGMRDALKKVAPGAKVVVDSSVRADTKDEAFQTASTALQRFPDIKVVLGWDTHVLGALAAFRSAGKLEDSMYFSGVDGEQEAIDEIKKGGAYKASYAWPMEPLAYAWTKYAADWLQGRSIPKVIGLDVIELRSPDVIDQFLQDMADAKHTYLKLPSLTYLGNISYDTRQEYARELYEL
jgi:ribose transport system substrate-binding protein